MLTTEVISVNSKAGKKSHWQTYLVFALYFPLFLLITNGLFTLGLDELHMQIGVLFLGLLIFLSHYIVSFLNSLLPVYKNIDALRLVGFKIVQSSVILLLLTLLGVIWYVVLEHSFWFSIYAIKDMIMH